MYVLLVRKLSGDMLWACAEFLVKIFHLIWPIERETRELRVCTLSVAQVFREITILVGFTKCPESLYDKQQACERAEGRTDRAAHPIFT